MALPQARWPISGRFLTLELQTAFLITAGTLALFTFYWEMSKEEFLLIFAHRDGPDGGRRWLCNLLRTYPLLRPIRDVDRRRALRAPRRAAPGWRP